MADRNRELAVIHVAKKQLGLADADYRALLNERYGVLSSAALTDAERSDLICELERRGFKKAHKTPFLARRGKESGQLAKVRAMLAAAGRPHAYGDALAQRMAGVERLEWCKPDDLRKIIAALMYDQRRRAQRADSARTSAP